MCPSARPLSRVAGPLFQRRKANRFGAASALVTGHGQRTIAAMAVQVADIDASLHLTIAVRRLGSPALIALIREDVGGVPVTA